jgi:non-canonical (house-cleaning) NTP pyrophosphatase
MLEENEQEDQHSDLCSLPARNSNLGNCQNNYFQIEECRQNYGFILHLTESSDTERQDRYRNKITLLIVTTAK